MTNAELAILGLIVERPRHGYEIEKVIEERGMREWTEVAFSSIYYILRKLEKKNLIHSRLDTHGSDPFLLGLAGMPAIQTEEAVVALRRYSAQLAKQRDHVRERWRAAGEPLPLFLDGMFDLSVSLLEARIAWVDDFIAKLEEERKKHT
jgi:hypothetical protein